MNNIVISWPEESETDKENLMVVKMTPENMDASLAASAMIHSAAVVIGQASGYDNDKLEDKIIEAIQKELNGKSSSYEVSSKLN